MHWSQFCGELCCRWQSEDVSLEIAGFLSGLGFDTTVAIRSSPLRLFDQVRHDNGIYDLRRNLIEWLSVKDKKANRLLEIFYERGCISYINMPCPPYLHLATSEMWCWSCGREYEEKCLCVTVLCTIILVQKGTSSSYRSVDCIRLWSRLV